MKNKEALVIGSGAFGTAIGKVLSLNFERVVLYTNSEEVFKSVNEFHENTPYFKGKILPSNISSELDLKKLVKENFELVVFALPTSSIDPFLKEHKDFFLSLLKKDIPFISLSKGMDSETFFLPDEIFYKYFSDYAHLFSFLSGPSFAEEILDEHITAVSLAGVSYNNLEKVAPMLDTSFFKAFITTDVKGVLLGGALKNVLAIGGGIIEGLGFKNNTRAALISRGILEMLRFGKLYNAHSETFYGLSGMGDLILTTTGELSRNKRLGIELSKGKKVHEILSELKTTVEGYKTAKATHFLSEKYNVRASIFNGIYSVLYENVPPKDAIFKLMQTQRRVEFT